MSLPANASSYTFDGLTLSHGGTCRNLWFDKSVTMLIFENGKVGINAEHTPVDAMTPVAAREPTFW